MNTDRDVGRYLAVAASACLLVETLIAGTLAVSGRPSAAWLPSAGAWSMHAATAILFLAWLYVRYRSLASIGWVTDQSPSMAVFWFFVPIYQLFKPYRILTETWSATETGNNTEVFRAPLVVAWWSTFVSSMLVAFFRPETYVVAMGLLVFAGIFAMALIVGIERRWTTKRRIPIEAHVSVPDSPAQRPTVQPLVRAAPAVALEPPPLPIPVQSREPFFEEAPPDDEVPRAQLAAVFRSMSWIVLLLVIFGTISNAVAIGTCAAALGQAEILERPNSGDIRIGLWVGMAVNAIALVPLTYLLRFRRAANRFIRTRDLDDVEESLVMQGRFWYFVGGGAFVVLSFEVLLIGAAIVLPWVWRTFF